MLVYRPTTHHIKGDTKLRTWKLWVCKLPALSSGRDKAVMRSENATTKRISVKTDTTVQKPNALQVKNRKILYSFFAVRTQPIKEKGVRLTLWISIQRLISYVFTTIWGYLPSMENAKAMIYIMSSQLVRGWWGESDALSGCLTVEKSA